VLPSDSAEFQVLAEQLGIAHCPGYPVYLLLAKLFTFLPFGDIAYRVNLFSAFMAALTVTGVYLANRLLLPSRWAAIFGAMLLTVSYTFWSQAVIAEVYSAGAAFTVWIVTCVLGWEKTGKNYLLFVGGLLGGLSLGVHTSVVVVAPGILVYLWLHQKGRSAIWRSAISGALAGVLIWLLVFTILDSNYPPANIFNGAYETARSSYGLSQEDVQKPWVRIWFVATNQQWRSALDFDWKEMQEQAGTYVSMLPREFSFISIALMVLGVVCLLWKRRDAAALFGMSLVIHWLISFNYRVRDIYVFYITGYVILAIFAAFGLDWICQLLARVSTKWDRHLRAGVSLLIIVFSLGGMLVPRMPAIREGQVPFIGEEGYLLWEDPAAISGIASMTVAQMKPESVFFVDWLWLYVYYYAAHVEGERLDLRFIEPNPRSDVPGLPHSVIEFIDANIDTRPIYFSRPNHQVERAGFEFERRRIWSTNFFQVVRRERR